MVRWQRFSGQWWRTRSGAQVLFIGRRVERRFAHVNVTTRSRHGHGYGGDAVGQAAMVGAAVPYARGTRGEGRKGSGSTARLPCVGRVALMGPRHGSTAAAHVPGGARRALECIASVDGVTTHPGKYHTIA
jgi:hypothetical protein